VKAAKKGNHPHRKTGKGKQKNCYWLTKERKKQQKTSAEKRLPAVLFGRRKTLEGEIATSDNNLGRREVKGGRLETLRFGASWEIGKHGKEAKEE